MMQEKAMVSDALNSINSGLKTYTDMISQSENQQLRSALQQMRNEAEQSQYELYNIAKNKNYYQPAAQANQNEINALKSVFSGNSGWSGSQTSGNMMGSSGNSGMSGSTGIGSMSGNTGMSGNNNSTGSSVLTGSNMSGSSGGIGSIGM